MSEFFLGFVSGLFLAVFICLVSLLVLLVTA